MLPRGATSGSAAAASPFPPLGRTVRPLAPEEAAERWLERFRELAERPVAARAALSGGDTASGGVVGSEPGEGR